MKHFACIKCNRQLGGKQYILGIQFYAYDLKLLSNKSYNLSNKHIIITKFKANMKNSHTVCHAIIIQLKLLDVAHVAKKLQSIVLISFRLIPTVVFL